MTMIARDQEVKEAVYRALNNALQNSYDPNQMTLDENINSLLTFDSDLEGRDPDEIRPHVESWLANHMGEALDARS